MEQTSQQRLKALNKSDRGVLVDLNEAADILTLPEAWHKYEPRASEELGNYGNQKRAEWLLKWLLGRLNSDAVSAANPRLTRESWIFLRWLVSICPVQITAKLLAEAQLLHVLRRALTELDQLTASSTHGGANEVTLSVRVKPSKKRKRGSESPASDANVASPDQQLLGAIEAALLALVDLTKTSAKTLAEHMMIVLTCDVERAAKLLHLWQKVLLSTSHSVEGCTLSAILPIWEASVSRGTSDTQAVASTFSSECLISTLNLLGRIRQDSTDARPLRRQTEQLLLHHLVLPVRSSALTAISKSRRRKEEEAGYDTSAAEMLLQPYHQKLLDSGRANLLQSASMIFDIALSVCNRSTPKYRAQEDPWLLGLFVALCNSAGVPVVGDQEMAGHPMEREVLRSMLDACLKQGFSPGTQLLESIMTRYSGMSLNGDQPVSWPLIARVLKLDANVFLTRAAQQQPVEEVSSSDPLHQLIIHHLSSVPWLTVYDIYTTAHYMSKRDGDGLDESGRAFAAQNDMSPVEFMSALPIALMNAYAHARNLPGFLDIWHAELVKSTRHIVTGTSDGSIWEDQSLAVALRGVFESSLTERQILKILTRFAAPFAQLEDAQNILYVFTELRQDAQGIGAAASLVLLDALTAAMRSDAVVEVCKEELLSLHRSLLSVGSKPSINKLPMMHRVWRTLSSIQALILPRLKTPERRTLIREVAISGCSQAALEAVKANSERERTVAARERVKDAADFILALHRFQTIEDVDSAALEKCVDCVAGPGGASRDELVATLLRYPYSLEAVSTEKRSVTFEYFITAAATRAERDAEGSAEPSSARANLLAVVELAATTLSTEVRNDLLRELVKAAKHAEEKAKRSRLNEVSVSMLMRFPPSLIPRSLREECLDNIYHFDRFNAPAKTKDNRKRRTKTSQSNLAFMVRLMDVPNASAEICKSPKALLQLCDDEDIISQPPCQALYEELIRRVLDHTSPQSTLAKDMAEIMLKELSNPSRLRSTFWLAARHLVSKVDIRLRDKLLMGEVKAFQAVVQSSSETADDATLEQSRILVESFCQHWQYIRESTDCMGSIDQSLRSARLPGHPGIDRLLLRASHSTALEVCTATRKALDAHRSMQDQRQILADLEVMLRSRSLGQRVDALNHFEGPSSKLSSTTLKVLRILLTTLNGSHKGTDEADLQRDILAQLANEAAASNDAQILGLILDCTGTVLSERSWLVSQYSVDALLSCFTVLTSSTASATLAPVAGGLYLQLCAQTTSLVALQRIKLRGRFHLLMPLLVNLLSCLFVPYARTSSGSLRLPGWLSTGAAPLHSRHATAFARLLSTLASPTVSSVSSFKRRRGDAKSSLPLKDETKIARAYVGGYVPVLMAAYCSAQLHGKLSPEVKDALLPGLWSCMETVEMDAWRAMSERLRENERAVWQSVWAEWKRAGGGGRVASRDKQPV